MPEITLRQMQYFVSIVDLGSVTAAAEACHISQAAVLMSVTELERSLETDLLIRSRSRKAVPTQAGLEFAAHARADLDRVAEAREAMDEGPESCAARCGSATPSHSRPGCCPRWPNTSRPTSPRWTWP